jgi:hypothetical protein
MVVFQTKYFKIPKKVLSWQSMGMKIPSIDLKLSIFSEENLYNKIETNVLFEPQFMAGILKGVGVADLSLFQGHFPPN